MTACATSSRRTRGFVGPGLATLYGLEAPSNGLQERELGPARLGYFMQVPFLLLTGTNRVPNPIQRGLALNGDVLCMRLPAPPSSIPPIPAPTPGETNRERITALTAGCGDCHRVFVDPLGFAFEGFDGMGQAPEARRRQADRHDRKLSAWRA